jgi:hypothetical protein
LWQFEHHPNLQDEIDAFPPQHALFFHRHSLQDRGRAIQLLFKEDPLLLCFDNRRWWWPWALTSCWLVRPCC